MHFTTSTILAIEFMDRIARPGHGEGFPQPCWTNFRFWHDIKPGPITVKSTEPPSEGVKKVEILAREVTFCLIDTVIAVVRLEGRRAFPLEGHTFTSWAVSGVRYATTFWGGGDHEATDWYERDFPVASYVDFAVSKK
jgi:hypothetical protein